MAIAALFLALALNAFYAPSPARAQLALGCSLTVASLPFGSIANSFGGPYDGVALATLAGCSVASPIRVCINLGAGTNAQGAQQRLINITTTTSYYNYNLYTNSARTLQFGANAAFVDLTPTAPTGTFNIYGQLAAAQTTPGIGLFVDTISSFSYATTTFGSACPTSGYLPMPIAVMTVSAVVIANCIATTPGAMNFGAVAGPNIVSQLTRTTTLTITCNSNTPYAVYADNGQNAIGGGDPLQRRMTDGAQHYILYMLYKSGSYVSGNMLGSSAGNGIAGSATGASQTISIFGVVPPQSAPFTGTYSDSVAVTVQF